MSYWQLLYHAVWQVHPRSLPLRSSLATEINTAVRSRAMVLGGTVFAVNSMADHLHLVVAVPPRLAVATFIGLVKSGVSAQYNRGHEGAPRFAWAEEYGVFSFDRGRLPNLIRYVENQQQHHANKTTIPMLERTTGGAPQLIREPESGYYIDSEEWRNEMLALDVGWLDET